MHAESLIVRHGPRGRRPARFSSGTLDFLGLNLYYGQVVAAGKRPDRGALLTDAAVDIVENGLFDPGHDPLRNYKEARLPLALAPRPSWGGVINTITDTNRRCHAPS